MDIETMNKKVEVLIVDDHHFIVEAYKHAWNKFSEKGFEFIVTQAGDCKTGYELITGNDKKYDMAMFDVSMPEYPEKNIRSGIDLAKVMKQTDPECKIMMLTMHVEADKINNIIENVDPNCLLIKNDINFHELVYALEKTLNGSKYYSETIINMLGTSSRIPLEFDAMDNRILEMMARNYDNEVMARHVPLTIKVIEMRRTRIQDVFKMPGASDAELVEEAQKRGILPL